jgi:hypothetical protein
MRVPQYATRTLAAVALTVLAACGGGDSNAPDAPFDPDGTATDIQALDASFESEATAGFAAASGAIADVLEFAPPAATAVRAMPTKALITGRKRGADHYAAKVAKSFRKRNGTIAAFSTAAAIPAQHLGVTFVYNEETGLYEASELPGAPENGVRFVVYAINPISGQIIEPAIEVGHADIVVTETASSATVRIELVSGDVTFLDYSVAAIPAADGGTIAVSGFVTNGDDRVNFDLDTRVELEDEEMSLTADYSLVVPTRGGFRIDFEGVRSSGTTTSTLQARGPHGTVTITGSHSGDSGTFEVEVNGEAFATITYTTGEAPEIVGADGEPLTEQETEALAMAFAIFIQGFDIVEDLLDPLT